MHEGELGLSDDDAERLIAQRFPELASVPVRRVHTTGTVNTIVRIGDDLAARFPLLPESEAVVRAESDALAELAEFSVIPSPQPHGVGEPTPEYPSAWSVQTWLPGEPASPVDHESSDPLALDVVAMVSALRAAPVRGRSFDGHGRGGTLTDHDEWVAECIGKGAHLLDADRVRRLWAELRELPSVGPDVMSHRDLTPFNLLVSQNRLSGVLDGGGFGPADRALDLVVCWHLFDERRRELIRSGLDVETAEWRRGAAWALQQAMGLVWYYERSNPPMSALGLSTMRRLLHDPELSAIG
ncbi:aminoglycoside phosphotransferase family protein [Microbacterium hydrocarbonoxydans]|uniref:Predicted kinase, aminoglycoside phosphotransferase (APT) family n=1 Tax=Microbacterium hydrocarbonoxydans TaxID=273678 RepID=A0A1H4T5W3_9MICO|nr:aminoglycoside phosphotransferase family protein [Microbacterium hydrocarbonoxydans]SEB97851.1 Predicted kinase, aminoglycoside phosphotransferase (APT) family [Microbacterium hydrocarbonoxydans]SEC51836.1 Predicted kinase, aminoglycoside phosphotransferase (APT) family [Microbacterium hydrocarbonoxydans]